MLYVVRFATFEFLGANTNSANTPQFREEKLDKGSAHWEAGRGNTDVGFEHGPQGGSDIAIWYKIVMSVRNVLRGIGINFMILGSRLTGDIFLPQLRE